MPSPRRCARRSVALAARQGISRAQAAQLVMSLCDDVVTRLYQQQLEPDLTWITQVYAEARRISRIESGWPA